MTKGKPGRASSVPPEQKKKILDYAEKHGIREAAKHFPGTKTTQIYGWRSDAGVAAKKVEAIPEGVTAFEFTKDVVPGGRTQAGPSELELRTLKTLKTMPPPENGRPYSFLIPVSEGNPTSLQGKLRALINANFNDKEAVCFRFSIAKDNDKNVLGLRIFRTC